MTYESIQIYLNGTSQEVAVQIHEALQNNSWFGLYNNRRRLFFDIKRQIIYQISDGANMQLKVIECGNREAFLLLIKFSLIACKQLMQPHEIAITVGHIRLLIEKQFENGKEIRKQIAGRTPQAGQSDKSDLSG